MRALGWSGATRGPDEPPDEDPHGSPNFFFDFAAPVPFDAVAAFAVRSLREVYAIRSPRQLRYYAFASGGAEIRLPGLGLEPEEREQQASASDPASGTEAIMPSVMAALTELEWEGESLDETVVRVGVSGKHVNFSLVISVDEDLHTVACYGVLPNKVLPEHRATVGETLLRINYDLRIGAFDLDLEDGEVRLRNSLDVEGGRLTPHMAFTLMGTVCGTIDRFYPAITRVQFGDVDPARAVREAWATQFGPLD